ncbi:MAG: hypothetical protein P8Y18_11855 [Candidatus Bathyarchaeota archaeon]
MDLIHEYSYFRFVQFFGVLLLVLAFFVWFFPIMEIQSNQAMLLEADNLHLESEQIWAYDGALRWWKNVYASTIIPLVGILITSGLVTIIAPFILKLEHIVVFKRFRSKNQIVTLDNYFKSKEK